MQAYIYKILLLLVNKSFNVLMYTLRISHRLKVGTYYLFESIRAGRKTTVEGDKHLNFGQSKH